MEESSGIFRDRVQSVIRDRVQSGGIRDRMESGMSVRDRN